MKTSRVLGYPLILVVTLALSWTAAAPLHVDSSEEDVKNELEAFFDQNPSIAEDLYPNLLDEASDVTLTVNQNAVENLLDDYMRRRTVQDIEEELEREMESEEEEEGYPRKKRDTSIKAGINHSSNPFGRSFGGALDLSHSWDDDKHSLSGSISGSRHTVYGKGSGNSFKAGIGYNYKPSDSTSLGINAHKSFSPGGGSSHGIGLTFSHSFR